MITTKKHILNYLFDYVFSSENLKRCLRIKNLHISIYRQIPKDVFI